MHLLKKYSPKPLLWLVCMLLLLATPTLTSCCRQHFLKNFDQVSMRSERLILEARGDTVPFVIHVNVPKGLLCGGMVLKLTPYLKQDSLKTPFSPCQTKPEDSEIPVFAVSGKQEGHYTFRGYFMNFPQLQNSQFVIEWHADKDGKSAKLSERLVGYGISQIYRETQKVLPLEPGFDPASARDKVLSRPSLNAADHYFLALMSARLYDQQGVQEYLEKAITLDPSIKVRLGKDVEFIAYRKESWFQQWFR